MGGTKFYQWRWAMKLKSMGLTGVFCLLVALSLLSPAGHPSMAAEKPIVIGAPLATAFLYGWDAEKGIRLAAEEINAAGGVAVGKEKRQLKVEVIDTRDLEPGVPVSEALLGLEKLILLILPHHHVSPLVYPVNPVHCRSPVGICRIRLV